MRFYHYLSLCLFLFGLVSADFAFAAPTYDCATQSQLPSAECNALLTLYNNSNGPTWDNKTGWLTTNQPCSWYGISCTAGRVTSINLSYNNLSGTMPIELNDLTQLQTLILSTNQLSGSLPPLHPTNLDQLNLLHLDNNQFSGTLPTSLGELNGLTELILNHNQFSGTLPSQLGTLSNLIFLQLDNNQLSGTIPSSLGSLSNLLSLQLQSNQLNGAIPSTLGELNSLETLDLSKNALSGGIPNTFEQLSNLTLLLLNNNQLSGPIPEALGAASNLQVVHLEHNQLSGPLPFSLGNIPNLEYLYLNNNQLSGVLPTSLGNLINLVALDLQANQFSGAIPTQLAIIPTLTHVNLKNNRLAETIPALCQPSLIDLELGYNQLEMAADSCVTSKDGDWAQTQTVAPTNVAVSFVSSGQVQVSWTPISYQGNHGYYEVFYAVQAGGPYQVAGLTANKAATGLLVTGLDTSQTLYFVVRSFTPAHDQQQSNLYSENSGEAEMVPTAIRLNTQQAKEAGWLSSVVMMVILLGVGTYLANYRPKTTR